MEEIKTTIIDQENTLTFFCCSYMSFLFCLLAQSVLTWSKLLSQNKSSVSSKVEGHGLSWCGGGAARGGIADHSSSCRSPNPPCPFYKALQQEQSIKIARGNKRFQTKPLLSPPQTTSRSNTTPGASTARRGGSPVSFKFFLQPPSPTLKLH